MDVNIQDDLNAVNDQITKLVDELNKVNAARENLIQQIQNLNGVAMYLRGKLPPDENTENMEAAPEGLSATEEGENEFDRVAEYPNT